MAARRPSVSDPGSTRINIPKQTKDPVWSLKPWPVTLSIGEKDIEFPAAYAADWLSVLMPSPVDLDDVVATMAIDGDQILFDEDIGAELYDACLEVISTVSGRPWWQALRLIAVATSNWNVLGGEMFYRGVLPDQISLSAWLDVLLLVTIRSMEQKDVMMFTLQLEQPPAEVIEADPQEMEMSRDQFLSMGR